MIVSFANRVEFPMPGFFCPCTKHPPIMLKARLLALAKARASVFGNTFNPECLRTGAKVLRRSLRGDLIKDYYYPADRTLPRISVLNKLFPDLHCADPDELRRVAKNADKRRKGKGAPKKLKAPREVKGKRK